MSEDDMKSIRNIKTIFAFGLAITLVYVLYIKAGIFFTTNDDRFIGEIMSGSLTGNPEAHVVYINFILSFLLSRLYLITTTISWYGWFLMIMTIVSYSTIFASLIYKTKSISFFSISILLCGIVFISGIYLTSSIQYTSTAAIIAIAGWSYLYSHEDTKKTFIIFFMLELIAYLLRAKAMMMIIPFGVALFSGRVFTTIFSLCHIQRIRNKYLFFLRKNAKLIGSFIIIIGIFIIGEIGDYIGYSTKEWNRYLEFNNYRTVMFDYVGTPDYTEVKDILGKYSVSEAEYLAFVNYVYLDESIPLECIEELSEYAKETQTKESKITDSVSEVFRFWRENSFWRYDKLIQILWLTVILLFVIQRRWGDVVSAICLFGAKITVWTILMADGRLVNHVVVPLLYCEIILLIVLMWSKLYSYNKILASKTSHLKYNYFFIKIFELILVSFICIYAYKCGQAQYRYVVPQNQGKGIYIESLKEVQQYCNKTSKKYLLDNQSFMYYLGGALENDIYGTNNYIYTGTWFSRSPVSLKDNASYLKDYENEFFLIVCDWPEEEKNRAQPAINFFEEKSGRKKVFYDSIQTSSGIKYLIYKF